ncbi:MAG TPA: response regulator [Leptolyngbyaceae cyanobacterium M33_DOE_097]|uniref:histidine kinase n=1 Tax=Oscillatoriales cyanobacterium SpSt-418 TaxID=2282169 RepID=A0A7C3KEH3_9CYAN|nr:response regulator [Leptolyngbyaceae cyanobacterium M33_DOE_097]
MINQLEQNHLPKNVKADILIVDDTPDNLRVLSAMLTNQGYEVRKALNGQRAISSVQLEPPNLILLDIKMPGMDGYEVCRNLKASYPTCEVPIIFISALDDALDKVKAFASGGVDYITKPFQEAEVLARIEHQLRIQELQHQLVEQNKELLRSNRDLEQFAYVVSHDLQQPLQSVTGFVKLLQLKYGCSLDEVAQDYLNRIFATGNRMQKLIQDLLAYSQIDKQEQMLENIDCNEVLNQVLDNLQEAIVTKQATITHDSLPTVQGDETQLIQLFQNLISNALKFIPEHTNPSIHISATAQKNQWHLGVRDNGIGIKPEHLEKIFEIFQRIHSTQTYPGTGIGLATCKKIVERHHGKIWVESQFGAGTTFYFSLPMVKV